MPVGWPAAMPVAFVLLLAAGCSGGGGAGTCCPAVPTAAPTGAVPTPTPSATPTPVPTSTPVIASGVYAAFGASDLVAPDAWVYGVATNANTRYGITLTVANLGIGGAVIGPAIGALAPNNFSPDVLDDEIPNMPSTAKYVSLFVVVNDINVAVLSANADQTTFLTSYVAGLQIDIGFIQGRAPGARLVVVNSPNVAGMPFAQQFPLATRQRLQAMSNALDDQVINPLATIQNIPVVDLRCIPAAYDPANFNSDGLHPSASGRAILANLVTNALFTNIPLPPSSCLYTSLV